MPLGFMSQKTFCHPRQKRPARMAGFRLEAHPKKLPVSGVIKKTKNVIFRFD
jgi:hypothetical protein